MAFFRYNDDRRLAPSERAAQIESATKEAVGAIHQISGTIEEVSSIATNIASAVEHQGEAAPQIARTVQQTAQSAHDQSAHDQSAHDVTTNIDGGTRSVAQTGHAADQVLQAAAELSRQTENLTTEVTSFVTDVRAA